MNGFGILVKDTPVGMETVVFVGDQTSDPLFILYSVVIAIDRCNLHLCKIYGNFLKIILSCLV